MKFQQVTFRCFGPFEEKSLDFSGGNLHVIFGPNEAGKSTALRGLYAFLFGFGHTTADDYLYKASQFRIQATLQNVAGEVLESVRRKGKKATLILTDEKTEIAETELARFIGGVNESQFEQLFGLNSALLRLGGQLIADGEGDFGEALFAAGAGLAGLRKLADSLAQRQGDLYKSRSPAGRSQLPLNRALGEYKEALEAQRQQTLPPEQHAVAVSTATTKEARAETLRKERDQVRRELSELERFHLALPTIGMLLQARERFAVVANAPRLALNFGDKLHQALLQKQRATDKLQVLTLDHEKLEQSQTTANPPENLLAEEAEIDELKGLVAADWGARDEELKTDSRRKQVLGEARDIYRALTGTTDWMLMDLLQPRDDEENRLHDLANDAKAVELAVETAERQLNTTREALTAATTQQTESQEITDAQPLLALVETISALGPLEEKARELQHKLTGDERKLATEFSRLQPAAPGSFQQAAELAVPAVEAIADFRRRFESSQRKLDKLQDERTQLDRERITLEQQQTAANPAAEPLPSVNDLSATRAARDHGLQLLRRRLSNEADANAEKQFADQHTGRPLFETTEHLVRQADVLADRLRSEADQIARWQSVEQNQQTWLKREQTWQAAQQSTEAAHAELQQAWEQLWQAATITPQSPAVMEPWLTRWQRLCEQVVAWQENRRSLESLQQQIANVREQLTAACPAAQSAKSLEEALRRARQLASEAANRQLAASRLQEDIRRLQSQLTTAEAQVQPARKRLEAWKKDWAAAIRPLGLSDPSTSVATAQSYLKRIGLMQEHLKESRIKGKRLEELKAAREALARRWNGLRQRLQPGSKPSTLETIREDFQALENELKTARVSRTRQQERAGRLRAIATEIETTTEQLRTAEAELRTLATEASVAQPEELASALQRAQDRDAAEKEVRTHEQVLAGHARGQALDEFIKSALAVRSSIEMDLAAHSARADKLDPEIQAAEDESREARRLLKEYEQASSAAAHARQQAEFLITRLKEQVTEFAALQLAGLVLDQAKERYRARHQDTLLSRAGEFFRTLTDEKFATIEIDNEEGKDVLKAIRAAGHSFPRVPVGGLSEGTRDQLFLALRLAGIEQHLQNREPVPLIIDDVLMTFDDARSRATLRCLAELSTKTQVLLFTHHRHVGELAQQVQPATVVHAL
ncbi:AAA family ATPase [Anatilimnocola floriformis]|uniref:AAA family ATPase n=1 Tax=Anatilimnocola floriformis TaxID=2948575 RepID=UPI0020C233F3|nr:AAA family ATPase [Anatilimnocola floriformis]